VVSFPLSSSFISFSSTSSCCHFFTCTSFGKVMMSLVCYWRRCQLLGLNGVISCFHCSITEISLLGCYVAYSGNSLPTFWDNLSVPSSRVSTRR
jgi:hypothetical protein